MPVTTGSPVGLKTSIFTTVFLSVDVALTDLIVKVVVSFFGMKSLSVGFHVPVASERKSFCVPRNTFKSKRFPGTPYFGAIPHDEYCQIIHCDEQFAEVHECT